MSLKKQLRPKKIKRDGTEKGKCIELSTPRARKRGFIVKETGVKRSKSWENTMQFTVKDKRVIEKLEKRDQG